MDPAIGGLHRKAKTTETHRSIGAKRIPIGEIGLDHLGYEIAQSRRAIEGHIDAAQPPDQPSGSAAGAGRRRTGAGPFSSPEG